MDKNYATSHENNGRKSFAKGLVQIIAKLKTGVVAMIVAHNERVVSLRVYNATRLDGVRTGPDSKQTADRSSIVAAVNSPIVRETAHGLPTRIKNWIGARYQAHEARLAALRVYDRSRIDRPMAAGDKS